MNFLWVYGLSCIIFLILFCKMVPKSGRFNGYRIRALTAVVIIIMLGITMAFLYSKEDHRAIVNEISEGISRSRIDKTDSLKNTCYGIMFDAGSTGSRVHVFKFLRTNSVQSLVLVDSLFKSIKPGLSSYADNPKKAADSLKDMLDSAKQYIPEHMWSSTPIGLKATAGLRLLSNKTAKAILDEVLKLFQSYPFKLSDNCVALLEGVDEGLFSWFTVNFLNEYVSNSSSTVGVLDLGGGSTQVTYLPVSKQTEKSATSIPADHGMNVSLFDRVHHMYSHSYLGLGVMSMRFQVFGGKEITTTALESQLLSSICFPKLYQGNWTYGQKVHKLISSNSSQSRFDECYKSVQSIVNKYNIYKIDKSSHTPFYAISFFFDRAVEAKLIESNGGMITVQDFQNAAKKGCQSEKLDEPFSCVDLCYTLSLLVDGYGFSSSKSLVLRKQIKGFEIAWPLGAMFEMYGKFNKLKS